MTKIYHKKGHFSWRDVLYGSSFPGGPGCKESAYNAGEPDLIPGLGRYPGENYEKIIISLEMLEINKYT